MNFPFKKKISHYLKKKKAQRNVVISLYNAIPKWTMIRYYVVVENKPVLVNHYTSDTIRYMLNAQKSLE